VPTERCELCGRSTDLYAESAALHLDGYYCKTCLMGELGSAQGTGPTLAVPDDPRRALRALPALQAANTHWLRTTRRDAIRRLIDAGATWTELAKEMGVTRAAVRKAADVGRWKQRSKAEPPD